MYLRSYTSREAGRSNRLSVDTDDVWRYGPSLQQQPHQREGASLVRMLLIIRSLLLKDREPSQ